MAKYYDIFYSKKPYLNESDFIEQIIGNRKYILDLGCETGIHMKLLEDKGYIVDGLDISKEMLKIARTRVKGTLIECDFKDLELPPSDCVIACLVYHFVKKEYFNKLWNNI